MGSEPGGNQWEKGAWDARAVVQGLLVLAAASGFVLFFALRAVVPRLRPQPPGLVIAAAIACNSVPLAVRDWVYNSTADPGWHRVIMTDTSIMYLVKSNDKSRSARRDVRSSRTERFSRRGATIFAETRSLPGAAPPECWATRAMRQELVWELDGVEVWREGAVNAVAVAFYPRRGEGRVWLAPARLEFNAQPDNVYLRILQVAGIPGVLSAERDPGGIVRVNLDANRIASVVPAGQARGDSGVSDRLFVARIVNSLQGSTGVQGVKILINGAERRFLGSIDISRPLQFDTGVLEPGLADTGS